MWIWTKGNPLVSGKYKHSNLKMVFLFKAPLRVKMKTKHENKCVKPTGFRYYFCYKFTCKLSTRGITMWLLTSEFTYLVVANVRKPTRLSKQLIYITLAEVNLDASWRTTTAFSNQCSIVCSHMCNYLVDHFYLFQK